MMQLSATSTDWEDLPAPTNTRELVPVRAAMLDHHSRVVPKLAITIRSDVLMAIGEGDHRYRLSLGQASHNREQLRITIDDQSDPKITYRPRRLKGKSSIPDGRFFRFLLRPHRRFPIASTVKAVECAYEIKGKAILITLPRWAYDAKAKEEFELRRAARRPA